MKRVRSTAPFVRRKYHTLLSAAPVSSRWPPGGGFPQLRPSLPQSAASTAVDGAQTTSPNDDGGRVSSDDDAWGFPRWVSRWRACRRCSSEPGKNVSHDFLALPLSPSQPLVWRASAITLKKCFMATFSLYIVMALRFPSTMREIFSFHLNTFLRRILTRASSRQLLRIWMRRRYTMMAAKEFRQIYDDDMTSGSSLNTFRDCFLRFSVERGKWSFFSAQLASWKDFFTARRKVLENKAQTSMGRGWWKLEG